MAAPLVAPCRALAQAAVEPIRQHDQAGGNLLAVRDGDRCRSGPSQRGHLALDDPRWRDLRTHRVHQPVVEDAVLVAGRFSTRRPRRRPILAVGCRRQARRRRGRSSQEATCGRRASRSGNPADRRMRVDQDAWAGAPSMAARSSRQAAADDGDVGASPLRERHHCGQNTERSLKMNRQLPTNPRKASLTKRRGPMMPTDGDDPCPKCGIGLPDPGIAERCEDLVRRARGNVFMSPCALDAAGARARSRCCAPGRRTAPRRLVGGGAAGEGLVRSAISAAPPYD